MIFAVHAGRVRAVAIGTLDLVVDAAAHEEQGHRRNGEVFEEVLHLLSLIRTGWSGKWCCPEGIWVVSAEI